jgi:hypothetical protein
MDEKSFQRTRNNKKEMRDEATKPQDTILQTPPAPSINTEDFYHATRSDGVEIQDELLWYMPRSLLRHRHQTPDTRHQPGQASCRSLPPLLPPSLASFSQIAAVINHEHLPLHLIFLPCFLLLFLSNHTAYHSLTTIAVRPLRHASRVVRSPRTHATVDFAHPCPSF